VTQASGKDFRSIDEQLKHHIETATPLLLVHYDTML